MKKVTVHIDTTGPMFETRPRQEVAMILNRLSSCMASSDAEMARPHRRIRRTLYASDGKKAGHYYVT